MFNNNEKNYFSMEVHSQMENVFFVDLCQKKKKLALNPG